MLAVSTAVHDMLGGVVEHRGTDSTDLPDESKLLQRLYALNVMRLEGQSPDVQLWRVNTSLNSAVVQSWLAYGTECHVSSGASSVTTPGSAAHLGPTG